MTTKRKQPKSPITRSSAPAALAPTAGRSAVYPRLAELLREPALASLLRGAMLGGAALSAVAMSGCQPVECAPTRLGEVTNHGGAAFSLVKQLEIRGAGRELGVGIGIAPHPTSFAMGGAMVAVQPATLPTPPPVIDPAAADDDEPRTEPPAEPSPSARLTKM